MYCMCKLEWLRGSLNYEKLQKCGWRIILNKIHVGVCPGGTVIVQIVGVGATSNSL